MFRTEIFLPPSQFKITHQSNILTIGSCFADVIGGLLKTSKFNVARNPLGITFNPVSIFNLLCNIDSLLNEKNFIERDGSWYNYNFHSSFTADTKNELKYKLYNLLHTIQNNLLNHDVIIITLGTAWAYQTNDSGLIVANCHKVPAKHFTKNLLSVEQICSGFESFYDKITGLNPNVRIILTVSPVRHIKDTLPLNNVSKSVLRLASYLISENFLNVIYFPSFEIVMDDLRDYRFYKEDMIHPNEVAEKYIWQKFTEAYMENRTRTTLDKIQEIITAIHHRPFNPGSTAYKQFLLQTLAKAKELSHDIDFSEEIELLQNRIVSING